MARIITIRPQPGANATAKAGRDAGLQIDACPMSAIAPVEWDGPDAGEVDGLLVGSANVFRHGGAQLVQYRAKPVFAVGRTTAAEARKAGFDVAITGEGGLQNVLAAVPQRPMRLLRLSGARHVPVAVPDGISVETHVVYEAGNTPMSRDLAAALQGENAGGNALILLHSAGAAEHFASECARLSLDRARISLAALGPRIAGACGTGWADLRFAPQPAEASLLALAKDMCH